MAINKFVDRQGNTLLDLSTDSVSPSKVLAGTTYHGPDGTKQMGTLDPGPLDYSQYNFIDYDGTLLYSYTDEELDALTALPAGPDHTGDNLTFQSWNWTLADLKAWDRTRSDRPLIGANYITTDGKSYLYLDTPLSGATLSFQTNGTLNSVDWGDGTTDTTTSHVYTNPGQYVIVIDMAKDGYWYFGTSDPSTSTNKQWVKKIKLGNIKSTGAYTYAFYQCYALQNISIPNNLTSIGSGMFRTCDSLQNVIIPNSATSIGDYAFDMCYSLKNISIPNSITSIGEYTFSDCRSLTSITIPSSVTGIREGLFRRCTSLQNISILNSLTSIANSLFSSCYSIKNISIPNSITRIGTSAFYEIKALTLDLSKQTKVITLSSSIGLNNIYSKILVPSTLLADYKSASYWSDYASIMVGV